MFYLVSILKTSNLGHSISDNTEQLFQRGKEGVRIYSSFCNKRPDSQNVKPLLLILKKNQTYQINETKAFLCMGGWKVWAH